MNAKEMALIDVEREIAFARPVLERLPEAQFKWKAHEKSMDLGRLAMHVANLLQWTTDTLELDGLDMNNPPKMRQEATDFVDVLATFDANAAKLKAAIAKVTEADLSRPW